MYYGVRQQRVKPRRDVGNLKAKRHTFRRRDVQGLGFWETMKPDRLILLRLHHWERLSQLLNRRIKKLDAGELRELSALYRGATHDLSLAQREFPNHPVANHLNALVARSYPVVYADHENAWTRLLRFYGRELPQLFRSLGPYLAAGAALFYLPGVIMFFAVWLSPELADTWLSSGLISDIESGEQWWRELNNMGEAGASLIMTNNISVALRAFAGGVSFGLFTVYIAVMNGIHLGAVFGLLAAKGNPWPLAEFVIGHGVLELNAIVFATAAGLLMGHALLQPGLRTRSTALMLAAGKGVRLCVGTAPTLIIAGLIEGLISPSYEIPATLKVAIGISSGILLFAWLLLAGRGKLAREVV